MAWMKTATYLDQDSSVTKETISANQTAISTRTAMTVNTVTVTSELIVSMEVWDYAKQAAGIWETLALLVIVIPNTFAPLQGSQRYKRSRQQHLHVMVVTQTTRVPR